MSTSLINEDRLQWDPLSDTFDIEWDSLEFDGLSDRANQPPRDSPQQSPFNLIDGLKSSPREKVVNDSEPKSKKFTKKRQKIQSKNDDQAAVEVNPYIMSTITVRKLILFVSREERHKSDWHSELTETARKRRLILYEKMSMISRSGWLEWRAF